jgi:outer membrane protein insertion porin family
MVVGSTFTPSGLRSNITIIQDIYGIKGYIDTRIIARRTPNTQTGTMDLTFEVDEGDKSYIEKIDIRGNTKTKDKVIRRELSVAPGEVFDMVRVKRSQLRLQGLNYFEEPPNGVDATPEPTDIKDRRNLVISVREKNTGNIALGAIVPPCLSEDCSWTVRVKCKTQRGITLNVPYKPPAFLHFPQRKLFQLTQR